MKAPDKIYLDEDMIRYHVLDEKLNESDIEYIRKDTLLEWAKKELEKRRNAGNDYFLPAIVVLNDLIDKLNEL